VELTYEEWVARAPGLVAAAAARFGVEVGEPFEPGAGGFVAPAGTDSVLKVAFPHAEAEREPDALELVAGDGAVRLLARADDLWAMLLERADPGTDLWSLHEEEANPIAAEALRRFWRPLAEGHPFLPLEGEAERWVDELPRDWEEAGRPCPRALVDEAVALARELPAGMTERFLLHQDFHCGNVLASRRGWLVIDPKPLAGERAFDLASLVRDRRDELAADPSPGRRVARRFDQLTEALELDRARARGWAIVHALAWGMDHPWHVSCAEWIAAIEA
jgi:streptomycin 6-kinase